MSIETLYGKEHSISKGSTSLIQSVARSLAHTHTHIYIHTKGGHKSTYVSTRTVSLMVRLEGMVLLAWVVFQIVPKMIFVRTNLRWWLNFEVQISTQDTVDENAMIKIVSNACKITITFYAFLFPPMLHVLDHEDLTNTQDEVKKPPAGFPAKNSLNQSLVERPPRASMWFRNSP